MAERTMAEPTLRDMAILSLEIMKTGPRRAPPGFLWQEEIADVRFDEGVLSATLSRFVKNPDDPSLLAPTFHGFDPRCIARDFLRHYYAELVDIICNEKRDSEAAGTFKNKLAPACAGLAAFIAARFGLSEPLAISVATYLLVVLSEATKGAFCKMARERVEEKLAS